MGYLVDMNETAHKRIRGTWPDGTVLTATQRKRNDPDEWLDDRFGQAFDFLSQFIGEHVPEAEVLAHARHSFWDGCVRVVYVE